MNLVHSESSAAAFARVPFLDVEPKRREVDYLAAKSVILKFAAKVIFFTNDETYNSLSRARWVVQSI